MPEDQETPEFLAIGHVARDLLPDGRLASRRYRHLCRVHRSTPGIARRHRHQRLTRCAGRAEGRASWRRHRRLPCAQQTPPSRTSILLRGVASICAPSPLPLTLNDVPPAWRDASLVLLGPIAREVEPQLASAFPQATVAATPQGWLRQWDDEGVVSPIAPTIVEGLLSHLDALILSRDDLLSAPGTSAAEAGVPHDAAEADALIARWADAVPLVAVTRGPDGALLYSRGLTAEPSPGYPATEVDPTGAGDVFAAAFLCALRENSDAHAAMDFANRVAAYSVEHEGIGGIPTREDLARRFD